jgi:hypothetical protein
MLTKRCADCDEILSWKAVQLSTNRWPCQNCGKELSLVETALTPSDLAYKDERFSDIFCVWSQSKAKTTLLISRLRFSL